MIKLHYTITAVFLVAKPDKVQYLIFSFHFDSIENVREEQLLTWWQAFSNL